MGSDANHQRAVVASVGLGPDAVPGLALHVAAYFDRIPAASGSLREQDYTASAAYLRGDVELRGEWSRLGHESVDSGVTYKTTGWYVLAAYRLPASLGRVKRQVHARMLAKHPLDRPQRAVEVLEVFEGVLAADALKIKTARPIAVVADADPTVRSTARELLEREGYHVEAVSTARETLELVFSLDPALLVLDSNVEGGQDIVFASEVSIASLDEILPRHSGLGLCRLMQRDPALKRVPILVVTAQRHPGLAPAFALMGASEVINKPFTREEFEAAVHRARQVALGRADDT